MNNIINVWDIMNTPELLYSNMAVVPDEENKTCKFSLYPTHTGEMYIGVDLIQSNICLSNLKYVKFCYKQEKNVYPKLVLESPAYYAKLSPVLLSDEDGFSCAIFDISETFSALQKANTSSENPYKYSGDYSASMINLENFNSRYLRVAIYPFNEFSDFTAELKYIGFFDNKDCAVNYNVKDNVNDFCGSFVHKDYSYEALTDEILEKYTDEMNKRILDIKYNTKDISPNTIKGTCYYISSIHGNDSNNGLSPDSPWKTFRNLYIQKDDPKKNYINDTILKYGDGIFLERGSVFYPLFHTRYSGDYVMSFADGVTLSAYGDGDKPILTGALDINGSKNWVKTEYENIWRLKEKLTKPQTALDIHYNDVGHIVCIKEDGSLGNGIKILPKDPMHPELEGNMTINNGIVSTGFEIYESPSRECKNPGTMLKNNLEFYHDWFTSDLYMYCNEGNPAEVYKSVIVAPLVKAIFSGNVKDIVIDNITVKHVGAHGIQILNSKNVTIQNCTIEWIGGSSQSETARYGNGVEGWGSCDGFYILNTYVDQVYDGGLSTQFASGDKNSYSIMNDFKINDCVVTNTNSNIELWNYAQNVICSNFELRRNYLAYGGYHFGHQRPKKNGSLVYLGRFPGQTYENCIFENNVLMHASFEIFCGRPFRARGETNGTTVKNNVYIGSRKYRLGGFPEDLRNDEIGKDICDNQQQFTEETITKWHSFGLDLGSKFYYYDGPYCEEEVTYGLYRMRDENDNIIW